ncbi:Sodium/iodide cotransporter [Armadillidium nasatum]|uniref:Sodium/iodide cotransporter n=1 Tax=Armadillidium nasatum TaxID=96803 RepID=A0A5N5T7A3_9CRUS|nr:Sodium/iodide cotransporter [Armadillidium nasatum]
MYYRQCIFVNQRDIFRGVMNEKNGFGVADYSVFAGVLVISCGIGLYFSYKGNKSPEEFFMGNRRFPAEVYANGMQIWTIFVGNILAIMFSSYLFVPVLYPLTLTSVNEN